jgi:hypothetical protein
MRRIGLLAPILLAACAADAPPTDPAQIPVRGETAGHVCRATGTRHFIGQLRNNKTEAAIKSASQAAVLRWAPPGTMLTMDYRSDRVTVFLDSHGKITKITCG